MDQQFGGAPVQVRVSMGKEPRHFMAIFKGKLVIYEVRRGPTDEASSCAGMLEAKEPIKGYQTGRGWGDGVCVAE